jgi:hypothetical protein
MLRRLLSWKALRIAWSTMLATIAVLLCALWVRSYLVAEVVQRRTPTSDLEVWSGLGRVRLKSQVFNFVQQRRSYGWEYYATSSVSQFQGTPWFHWSVPFVGVVRYVVPHWFLASIAGFLAALPWASRRFNMRTMLVLTTLVAVFFAAVAMSL